MYVQCVLNIWQPIQYDAQSVWYSYGESREDFSVAFFLRLVERWANGKRGSWRFLAQICCLNIWPCLCRRIFCFRWVPAHYSLLDSGMMRRERSFLFLLCWCNLVSRTFRVSSCWCFCSCLALSHGPVCMCRIEVRAGCQCDTGCRVVVKCTQTAGRHHRFITFVVISGRCVNNAGLTLITGSD